MGGKTMKKHITIVLIAASAIFPTGAFAAENEQCFLVQTTADNFSWYNPKESMPCAEAHDWKEILNARHNNGENPVLIRVGRFKT